MNPVLEMHGVSAAFDGREVISNVDMKLTGGRITCLMGPSGCGKTTTLRLAAGLIKPTKGVIELLGKTIEPDTGEEDLIDIRRELGVVVSGRRPFRLNVGRPEHSISLKILQRNGRSGKDILHGAGHAGSCRTWRC